MSFSSKASIRYACLFKRSSPLDLYSSSLLLSIKGLFLESYCMLPSLSLLATSNKLLLNEFEFIFNNVFKTLPFFNSLAVSSLAPYAPPAPPNTTPKPDSFCTEGSCIAVSSSLIILLKIEALGS